MPSVAPAVRLPANEVVQNSFQNSGPSICSQEEKNSCSDLSCDCGTGQREPNGADAGGGFTGPGNGGGEKMKQAPSLL